MQWVGTEIPGGRKVCMFTATAALFSSSELPSTKCCCRKCVFWSPHSLAFTEVCLVQGGVSLARCTWYRWRKRAWFQGHNPFIRFLSICGKEAKVLAWAGNSFVDTELSLPDEYAFMGALIIQEVIKELVGKGLSTAKVLLLAGSRCVSTRRPTVEAGDRHRAKC